MSKLEQPVIHHAEPVTPLSFMVQPLALSLFAWSAGLRQMEALLEVQHRMVRRTALLCQHAATELRSAPDPSAALGIQGNVLIATMTDASKLCGELSLAAAPPLPPPVVQVLAEALPPGATPQQVTAWAPA
jgi:hypothetical protein